MISLYVCMNPICFRLYLRIREVLQEEYTASGGDSNEHATTEQNHVCSGRIAKQLECAVHQGNGCPAEKKKSQRTYQSRLLSR